MVDTVEMLDSNHFRLFFSAESPAESIVQQSVQQQWDLYELVPEQRSLEDLFIELTHEHEESEQ